MQLKKIINIFSFFVVYHSISVILSAGDIPYHEIYGFGTQTEGGLSGKVIKVTNLNNEGPGSFRAACEESGVRLVVFEVGGVINLNLSTIINRQSDVEDYPTYSMTNRVLNVPEDKEQRRQWLDSLSAAIDTDDSLDTSPLTIILTATRIKEQKKNQAYNLCLINNSNSLNPFITIKYLLPEPNKVTLKICSLTGQEIETLVNRYQKAGEYEMKWIAERLPAGLYLCRLQAGEYYEVQKLILQK